MLTLSSLARRNAEHYGDKPAFVVGDVTVTFREHNTRLNRLVDALQGRGICRGDRLAVLARNCLPYVDVYGAAEKGGFVIAPVNFRLTAGELTKVLARSQPRVLFAQEAYADLIDAIRGELPPMLLVHLDGAPRDGWLSFEAMLSHGDDREPEVLVEPDDLVYLISTSGTTGLPRAAMLTHRGQWLDAVAMALEMTLQPTDRHLATMPLYHIGGRVNVLAHTLRGCTVVLHDGFDTAAVLQDIDHHRITTTQVVPTMVAWLLDAPELERCDVSSLRRIWYASAPMPVQLLRRALDRFGPIFIQGYGQTESGPLVTALHPHEHRPEAPELASCGRAVPGVEVKVVDDDGTELARGEVGEVAVRSALLMVGYWEDPASTREALRGGWLHTGDMARMDDDGFVYLVDRKKDLVISGGENVFPREVEEVLYAHPAILEASVVGVPDDTWGERVVAFIVLREGQDASDEALIAFCKERLASYKCPKSVERRHDLPRTPSGKVLKRVLRADATRELAS